ncbi:hypothetical protein [Luteimonas fraxinea]|nr:hypothetical protein [Luteimonas fraxinea]
MTVLSSARFQTRAAIHARGMSLNGRQKSMRITEFLRCKRRRHYTQTPIVQINIHTRSYPMRRIALPLAAAMAFAFTACSNDPPPPDVTPTDPAPMNDTATPPVDPATDPMNPPPSDPMSPTPTDPTMPPPTDPMTQPPTDPTTTPPATPPVEGEGTTTSGS